MTPLRTLAVIGAGNMGSGIAQKMATEGFAVRLVDIDEERVGRGLATIDRTLAEAVERRVMHVDRTTAIRRLIQGTTRLEDVKDASLVVEAVFEDRALKQDLFRRYRLYVSCHTVDDLPYILQFGTEDNLLIGTDYSHADQYGEIEALDIIEQRGQQGVIPAEVARKILDDNPRRFYGL